jgi:hypothetical protein
MITKLLRRALGQAFSRSPKATKAARRVGVPTRDAGIAGRVGPGGGGLETGVVARPITRPSSVEIRPNNTPYTGTIQPNTAPSYVGSQTSSPNLLQRAGGLLPTGPLGYLGRGLQVLGGVDVANKIRKGDYTGAAVEAALLAPGKTLGLGKRLLFNPYGLTTAALVGTEAIAPASVADGTFAPGSAGYESLTPDERRRRDEMDATAKLNPVETNVPGRNFQPGGGGGFAPPPPRYEAPLPTREELEERAYQNEVSRVAQQADPFFRAGGPPMMNYTAEQGMAISRALYGDQLTPKTPNPLMAGLVYDETNPTMQGRNYNMENPVGVEQSSAQSLADYYRNGMMEQQTQGMGSEPGLESVLSPEDREMFLGQLRNFRPGGPG